MKKTISMITAALLALSMGTTAFAADINVSVDEKPVVWTDAKPFIDENDRTLVPLRPIANALGLTVAWDDDKNQASFTDGETTVLFTIGEKEVYAFLNDNPDFNVTLETDTAAVIANSRTYAPARYLAESFNYAVGWNRVTQTVLITKVTAPDEEIAVTPALPVIPEGEKAAAEPMVTEPGITTVSYIALKGMVKDPDIFAYESVMDCPVDSNASGLMMEDGYLVFDLQPSMGVAPGTYTVTWKLPGGWFEDGKDVIVTVPLTITKATVVSALTAAIEDLYSSGFHVKEGATAEEINAEILDGFWLFNETPFLLEISGGEQIRDDYLNVYWRYNVTVTDTETGESASGVAESSLNFDSFDW